jgi:23S rRNA pseudouridine2605 synthase
MENKPERLNKVLAQHGIGSRRGTDLFIEEGRVKVNGTVAQLGQKVSSRDIIEVDGTTLQRDKIIRFLLAFHKPKGVTTTKSDPFAKVTVMDYLPPKFRHLNPIGRLDRDSRGLLLFTNDGDLSLRLGHPRYEQEKEYEIVAEPLRKITLTQFKRDIAKLSSTIIDKEAQSMPIRVTKHNFSIEKNQVTMTIILREGKNRQIRRVLQSLGYFVTDLKRIRIKDILLEDLKEGEYREIDPQPYIV